jgi:hypothetical protein
MRRFQSRRSAPRRTLLAGLTAWSLSASACVQVRPRYDDPTVSLSGRDSLSRAYDLGVRDGKMSIVKPLPELARLSGVVIGLAGVAIARATKNAWVGLAVPIAALTGLTLWNVREAQQPTPAPADSAQLFYGMKSPQMWDSYVSGFKETVHQSQAKAAKASALGTAFVAATILLMLVIYKAIYQAIFSHIS